ncbi:MAG: DUF177 domain-containing protein [Bacteroidaceae bacterium]|jgi:uncharacterized metal-binding protein YceD (DUF177 family)|nr:DUF177 domain-containing protein [Bacteroidaceae bacterium]
MNTKNTYKIDLLGSHFDKRDFSFKEDDDFFKEIDGLINRGCVDTTVSCVCTGTVFKFYVHSTGYVIVPCDRCLSDLELRIDTSDELVVKLGDEYSDDGDCVIVPETEGYIDLAQFIYEFIALSMPITCTHEPGKCDDAMMQELSKHQTARSSYDDDTSDDSNEPKPIDERWQVLKDLINK